MYLFLNFSIGKFAADYKKKLIEKSSVIASSFNIAQPSHFLANNNSNISDVISLQVIESWSRSCVIIVCQEITLSTGDN